MSERRALRGAYDRCWESGRARALDGRGAYEVPPVDGRPRWGLSYVLRPDPDTLAALAEVGREGIGIVGPRRWAHTAEDLHVTVRWLEPYRSVVPAGDRLLGAYAAAMRAVAAEAEPVRLDFDGLALTDNALIAQGFPAGDAAGRLRELVTKALAPHGIEDLEGRGGFTRDIWHLTLTHFTGQPADPEALVAWVGARRWYDLGHSVSTELELVRWAYDGERVRTITVATAPLSG